MNQYLPQTEFNDTVALEETSAVQPWRRAEPRDAPSGVAVPRQPPEATPDDRLGYAWAVEQYYMGLFRFGIRLTRSESDAADLTQETYRILYAKGAGIRETDKIKGWLFTTLYRLFLRRRRHDIRFPAATLDSAEWDLPTVGHRHGRELDSTLALSSLQLLDDVFRIPLTMFYLQDMSYREVATALGVPIGTVMSRLSRGKNLLRQMMQTPLPAVDKCRHAKPGPGWRDTAIAITTFVPEPAEAA